MSAAKREKPGAMVSAAGDLELVAGRLDGILHGLRLHADSGLLKPEGEDWSQRAGWFKLILVDELEAQVRELHALAKKCGAR